MVATNQRIRKSEGKYGKDGNNEADGMVEVAVIPSVPLFPSFPYSLFRLQNLRVNTPCPNVPAKTFAPLAPIAVTELSSRPDITGAQF